MARLPALIDAFVRTDGRDRSTIEHVARVIREQGLIPTTKRGAGAAEMTVKEAVNLLFALNGASSPKDIVEAVQRMRLMLRIGADYSGDVFFNTLHDVEGLGDAIEYLIHKYPSILKFFGLSLEKINYYIFDYFNIEIEFHRARANILIRGKDAFEPVFRASYRLNLTDYDNYFPSTFDRRLVTYLSASTVRELWRCLSDGRMAEDD